MRASLSCIAIALAVCSCATTSPELSGALRGQRDTDEILRVARERLHTLAPGAYIFRVHFEIGGAVAVYYRAGSSGPARHLVVREVSGHWAVTDAPSKIDYDLPEEHVVIL